MSLTRGAGSLTTGAWAAMGIALLLVGCAGQRPDPTPLLSTPQTYARGGVQFSYPGNWTLSEKQKEEEGTPTRDISVGAEGSAGALLKVFEDPPEQVRLDEFIQDFSEALKDKIPDLVTLTEVTQSEVLHEVAGDKSRGVRKQFLFELFFKQFSVNVDFHRIDGESRSVFLVTVNADEQVEVLPGFELIRRTLKVF